ncbi:MAG: hypothetical protein FP825_12320 [Hyphomonas sp.]|nr:hypothetical protein [Hyphomonas sp.]
MHPEDIPLITLRGSARERGRQHGSACAGDIRRLRAAWERHVAAPGAEARAYMQQFRADTGYVEGFRTYAPHLLEEIEGIADGAGLPFDDIFDLQLLDEEWSYRARRIRTSRTPHHCSALALKTAEGVTLVAQNFDGVNWMEGFQRLFLHVDTASGQRTLLFSLPGLLALNGVNGSSVGVCVNSLVQLDGNKSGLPVMGVIRLILEANSFAQAREVLKSVQSGSGQNYVIGGADGFGSFEASGRKVVQTQTSGVSDPVAHTNHPLANPDDAEYRSVLDKLPPEVRAKKSENSCARYAQLVASLAEPGSASISGVKDIFSSTAHTKHPLSREMPATLSAETVIDYTLACTVFELGPKPAMHIAAGPPSCTDFRVFDLSADTSGSAA